MSMPIMKKTNSWIIKVPHFLDHLIFLFFMKIGHRTQYSQQENKPTHSTRKLKQKVAHVTASIPSINHIPHPIKKYHSEKLEQVIQKPATKDPGPLKLSDLGTCKVYNSEAGQNSSERH